MTIVHTRRRFLAGVSMAGAAGLLRVPAKADEERLETTSVRFMRTPSICHAPQFVIEDLLRAEGFTDIRYVEAKSTAEINPAVASGKVDFNTHFAPQWVSDRQWRPGHGSERRACRLLRIVWKRKHPQHRRLEGKEHRRAGPGVEPARVHVDNGRLCGARPG